MNRAKAVQKLLPMGLGLIRYLVPVGLLLVPAPWAFAQDTADLQREIQQLQKQLIEVQQESHARLKALQAETDAKIHQIQQQLQAVQGDTQLGTGGARTVTAAAPAQLAQSTHSATAPDTPAEDKIPSALDRLNFGGDFRLRYEANSSDGPLPSWDRWVLRGRFATRYDLTDDFKVGARLVTGDPDNPRTADVTVGDFTSDLDISLDQAYFAWQTQNLLLTGGKFAKPFSSTELVWDGDVNPEGLGGYYDFFSNDTWKLRLSGLYFAINENTVTDSSDMFGGQISLTGKPAEDWETALHLAYFDYDMGLLNPLVPGGARGNLVTADRTRYVSDFNLFDVTATIAYRGLGDRWKLWLTADYVRNLGAEIPQDSGFGVDLFAGSLNDKGHWLLRYGYAEAGADAVLGLYSHDNIVYPTNYRMHTLSADYALSDHAFVGLTNYLYKNLDPDPLSAYDQHWINRTRLNLYFVF